MKRTDLEKHKALKLMGQMHHAATPGRFGQGAGATPDRREQRKMDQAAGLVPFAVKLHQDLVRQLQGLAAQEGIGLGELTARLLTAGLGASADQAEAKPAKKAAVRKAVAEQPEAKEAAVEAPAVKKTAAKKAAAKTARSA